MATEQRLIDANALVDTIEDIDWYHVNKKGKLCDGANPANNTPLYKAVDIYQAIANAPTVDAVEVVHGRWVNAGGDLHYSGVLYNCSVCNKVHFVNARHALVTLHYHDEIFNKPQYCPHFGAKMDGGNEDGNLQGLLKR